MPTLTIPDTHNNVTIDTLIFKKGGTASLAGGGFGSITLGENSRAKTLAELLAPGYCYYTGDFDNRENGTPTLGEGLKTLTNVYVAKCDHSGTAVVYTEHGSYNEWTCPCGEKAFQARVTAEGATQYCETVADAFAAAPDGSKIDILDFNPDNSSAAQISTDKDLTVEIVGRGPSVTSLRFTFTGKVRFLSAGWDKGETHYSASFYPLITVAEGGELTVPEYYDSGNTVKNAISFSIVTVSSGGSAVLGGSTYHILTADSGAVNLSGSSVRVGTTLAVQNGGTLIADGGSQIDWLNVSDATATVSGSGLEQLTVQSSGTVTLNNCTVESSSPTGSGTTVSGGEVNLRSGSVDYLYVYANGTLRVSGGKTNTLETACGAWEKVTLAGGSFGKIALREYEDKILESVRNVTYADFAAMLSGGKGYQKSDGTYAGSGDVAKDDYYDTMGHIMLLRSVTVADAPFTGLRIIGDSSVTYGGSVMLRAEMDIEPAGITYQWYRNGTAIENATGPSYTTDPTLDAGDYTYTVEAACSGYVTGASRTVTVEPRVIYPILDYGKLSKEYDGTAIADVVITGFSFAPTYPMTLDLSTSEISYEITNPQYEKDDSGTPTADVGTATWVGYTLTPKETNYALGRDNETGDFFWTETNHVEVGDTAITKAPTGYEYDFAVSPKTITILNRHIKTYEIDLNPYLPALEGSRTFGDVTYTLNMVDIGGYYSPRPTVAAVDGSTLTLPVVYVDSDTVVAGTLTTRSGKEIALTDLGGGKYSFKMSGSRVTVTADFAEDNSVLNFFVDVPNDSYFYEAVAWVAENGIVLGTG